jgi:hypothetical protein
MQRNWGLSQSDNWGNFFAFATGDVMNKKDAE